MNITVFGGAGFIGANFIKLISDFNYQITLYDRNTSNKILPDCSYKIIEGDFFSETEFDNILYGQDVVVHSISSVSPYTSMVNIKDPYEKDVLTVIRLLEAARKNMVNKVVFLSSGGTVYGNSTEKHLTEEMYSTPLNHYGIMKLTIEKILLLYNELYDMDNIILRVANPYGLGQSPQKNIGAVSIFLDKILKNEEITLFGDGSIVRDYIEISDVSKALLYSIQYRGKGQKVKPIFNVGTGVGTSLIELISVIEKVTNMKSRVSFLDERNIDVKRNVLNTEKANNYLKFNATTSLTDGIRNLYNFKRREL
ncbi:UDP-glucose 4-epimerase [compost metagenome]